MGGTVCGVSLPSSSTSQKRWRSSEGPCAIASFSSSPKIVNFKREPPQIAREAVVIWNSRFPWASAPYSDFFGPLRFSGPLFRYRNLAAAAEQPFAELRVRRQLFHFRSGRPNFRGAHVH